MPWSACQALFLFLCSMVSAVAGTATALETVDLQLRWHHQFQFAGYYAAVEKGFYREEGLDVRLHAGDPAHQPVAEVLAGHAQYAEGNSEVLFQRLLGKPLVALAAIFQHSPSVLLAHPNLGIDSVHDLIGKKIMLMNVTDDADFLTMFQSEGIALSQLQIIPSSYDLEDFISGRVDAFNSYLTNEPYVLKQRNIPYRVISPSSYRIDFYSDILFTTEAELRQHPRRVEALLRATLKGWRYAFDHQDEMIDLLIDHYPVKKTREHLQFEAEEMRKLIFPDLIEMGHMNPGRWQHMADAFVAAGLIKPGYSLEGFIYDATPRRLPDWALPAMMAILLVLAVVSSTSYYLHRLNRRLLMTQHELLKSKQQRDEAQRIAQLGSWEWDIVQNKINWSEEAAQIFAPDNPAVTPSLEIFRHTLHPSDFARVMAAIDASLMSGEAYDIEYRVVSKLKGERHVHAQGHVFRDGDGKAIRMIGTTQDITQRKQLEEDLKRQARTDYLTGVSNRRDFMERAEIELIRAQRYHSPLCLCMMDIDFFKQINDAHGHKAGDDVLKKLAEVCRETLREVDVIGRVGGEEFSILLPETTQREAVEVAERLRTAIGQVRVAQEKGVPIQFTVSIGVASLTASDENVDELLHFADHALYEAKKAGRNRVCAAEGTRVE